MPDYVLLCEIFITYILPCIEADISDYVLAMENISNSEHLSIKYGVSKEQVRKRLEGYGFIEISKIFRFLDLMCESDLDVSAFFYIRSQLSLCLLNHDNWSDYFIPLREFAAELDCFI